MANTVRSIQDRIEELKREKDICILAHSYQGHEIVETADFTGDSYKLSVDATKVTNKNVVFCGVHFMAETAKMLSPEKHVFLAHTEAGCPMAEQMDAEMISAIKAREPDRKVVAYINTTASLKTVCDVCVTSSSAVKIVSAMPDKKLLFIPDCNLGAFVQKACPDKDIMLLNGGCPVHAAVTADEVTEARAAHPNALLLVHPECRPAVSEQADYVGSTSGIIDFAKKSDCKEFIIGTEISIAEHLQFECPDKRFHILSKKILCPNMKMTNLTDVLRVCEAIGTDAAAENEILMSDNLIAKAKVCIDEMLRLGG